MLLSPEEIARLLEACGARGELGAIARLALTTGADRGTLLAGRSASGQALGLLVRQVSVWADGSAGDETYRGEVYLRDRKADKRPGAVAVPAPVCRELLALCVGKGPEETVFEMRYAQLDFNWHEARTAAGLVPLRFKDLRHQWGIYAERRGSR